MTSEEYISLQKSTGLPKSNSQIQSSEPIDAKQNETVIYILNVKADRTIANLQTG